MPDIVDDDVVVNPLSYVETHRGRRPRYVSVMVTKAEGDATALLFIEGDAGPEEESEPTLLRVHCATAMNAEWVAKAVGDAHPCLEVVARRVASILNNLGPYTSWQATIKRLVCEQKPFLM